MAVVAVCGTMAAPQQDRRQIKVGASFGGSSLPVVGAGRALPLFQEPLIITEPLPGQEFVFISANPSPAAGGRAARFEPVAVQKPPSIRIESAGPGTILEDGILIAVESAGERDGRELGPVSLPELLSGPAVVREIGPIETTAKRFSLEDAVIGQTTEDRQGKAIGNSQEETANLIPAESVSRRTVIKTAPNGQDYEYEYLYYDGIDVDETNSTTSPTPVEPNLFTSDQTAVTNEVVSQVPEVEELTTEPVEVQEELHVAKVAFTVGQEELDENITTEDVDVTTTTTEATTTTTTTTEPPTTTTTTAEPTTSRRRRPSRPTSVAPARVRSTTPATEEPAEPATKRVRGKNRFTSSQGAANAVSSESKPEGASRRRISKPVRPSAVSSSHIENRAGLAQVRTRLLDFDGEEQIFDDVATNDPIDSNDHFLRSDLLDESLDVQDDGFNRQEQAIEHFPINGRFPPRLLGEDDFSVQERTPLRVVESSSFRNSGNQASGGEQQISAGRLTVLSGPARLPPPPTNTDTEEQEEVVQIQPVFADFGPIEEVTEAFQPQLENEAEPEVFEPVIHDEPSQVQKPHSFEQVDNINLSKVNRPDLIDLLAFSRIESEHQQQHDEELAHDFDDVLIEEVVLLTTTATPPVPTTAAPQQQQQVVALDQQVVQQLSADAELSLLEKVNEAVADFLEEAVTTAEPVVSIEEIQSDVVADLVTDAPKSTETLSDVTSEVFDVENVVFVADLVESTSTTITTTTTTTTTEAPTTTTTTEEPTSAATTSRIRVPSRFGGSTSNANRFNNRIQNRVRGGSNVTSSPVSTTTTTTTSAPVRKSPSFRPGTSSFSRLRRPTTAAATEKDSDQSIESSSAAPVSTSTTTRRPLPTNIRSRFQIRRNQTDSPAAVKPEEPAPAVTVKPKPAGQLQSNRIAPARPMSSILKRGRFSTTTTSTSTEVAVPAVTEEAIAGGEVTDPVDQEIVSEKAVTTEATTTTTTTARSVGLNRLRTRLPLAVSERPKSVRTQVSLSDRRNRFSVLGTSKKVEEPAAEKEETLPAETEEVKASPAIEGPAAEPISEASVEAVVTATPLRSRRPSRIPGQLVAARGRTSSS